MPIPRKKLIEVSLPLDAINAEAAREKSIRHGHPSTLHLWWARRPLAAARAVIFASMVDDPSEIIPELLQDKQKRRRAEGLLGKRHAEWGKVKSLYDKATAARISAPPPGPEPTLEGIIEEFERNELFALLAELVKWENITNEGLLEKARGKIRESWVRWCKESGENPEKLPPFHDPFAGGGALPLEAQRLGLEAHASDLNPVAVMVNKATIEIPPRFRGQPPVNPGARAEFCGESGSWQGVTGLASDVHYYCQWMRDEAEKRIGHLYPKAKHPDGREATVIAWLWARTVESPNPAYHGCHVPLVSSFWLSTKPARQTWVEPVVDGRSYHFVVRTGEPADRASIAAGTKLGRGANFRCILSQSPISPSYIKAEGMAGRLGARLMAIVAEGERGRAYFAPTPEHEAIAESAVPDWKPEQQLPNDPRNFWTVSYGLTKFGDLFSSRQLVALSTFVDLISEVRSKIYADALNAGFRDDTVKLCEGGSGAHAYSEAVSVYLAFTVDRMSEYSSTICTWASNPQMEIIRGTFARQSLPMTWDFAEANIFARSSGSHQIVSSWIEKVLPLLPASPVGQAYQADASKKLRSTEKSLISSDPPYYDNIGYADLSDYFYVWMRRSLHSVFPELFGTLLVPKDEELVATPYRHGSKDAAESFFMKGMTDAMHSMIDEAHNAFPVTIYYAFKQSENDASGTASTGWETFLEAVIRAGFALTGTWPMRTERSGRMIEIGTNALASSIILVCRPRHQDAPMTTRKDFLATLRRELPPALRHLQNGNIAPVDLAQASIGPGMAVYSRYSRILESDGTAMGVRTALQLINQMLDEVLAEQEGDFDAETGWAVAWFDQFGFHDGPFGEAETLSKAKNSAVNALEQAGIITTGAGKVRLLRAEDLPSDWNPLTDKRLTVWETTHHLIRVLNTGEDAAAILATKLGPAAEPARELAYRLYVLCERRKRSVEAQTYNALVQAWGGINLLAAVQKESKHLTQSEMAV